MNNSTLNSLVGLIEAMQLKDRIKEAMDSARLTKAGLARATKASPGAITQWLTGETKSLKAETATSIERATGYRASWIVDGKGAKLIADLPSNPPLATVNTAQAAINNVASLEQITEALAGYLMQMDDDGRDDAGDLLRKLAHKPEGHARTAAMLQAAFHSGKRRAA
jgi:transcriptional regulator with XRE-family HTH domain